MNKIMLIGGPYHRKRAEKGGHRLAFPGAESAAQQFHHHLDEQTSKPTPPPEYYDLRQYAYRGERFWFYVHIELDREQALSLVEIEMGGRRDEEANSGAT